MTKKEMLDILECEVRNYNNYGQKTIRISADEAKEMIELVKTLKDPNDCIECIQNMKLMYHGQEVVNIEKEEERKKIISILEWVMKDGNQVTFSKDILSKILDILKGVVCR